MSKYLIALLCVSAVLIFLLTPVWAGEPSNEPILTIETGMHTATINRIGIDAENRFLVTGSTDKTIRLWELASGNLLKVFRIPIGAGDEGKIDAVAISPDGQTIAGGGWTEAGEEFHNIYLFDRSSGRMLKRLTGLPNVIVNLAYSRDGKFLVACLADNGIRIYRTTDYDLIGEDKDYGSDSYGADFDATGRLVTASYDGFVRLYDKDLKLIAKEKVVGGNQPFSVSFSPDGARIAVGFQDSFKVAVLSAKDLSFLYAPDTTGIDHGNLDSVIWSEDGKSLYAGGTSCAILKWSKGGKGNYQILKAADNTIMQIFPLSDGGIVFGLGSPAFGVIDGTGELKVFKSAFIADHRANLTGFLVSQTGDMAQFGYEYGGKSPALFSIEDRTIINLTEGITSSETARLSPPRTKVEGLEITDWIDSYNPKVNGEALKLGQYERSRSLAIAGDEKTFLLGTNWYLRLFNSDGTEKWEVPVPGVVWTVNISGNDQVAIAGFSDGTIRWYRLKDGKELLAFFSHNDKKRWVVWTPSGYYDASPGAEELIGWHINNGKDNAADFFPASKFRSTYYRPDVIAKILDTLDEAEAVRLADAESGRKKETSTIQKTLPPVVNIISPRDGEEVSTAEIIVKYTLRTPSEEPVTGIKTLVDGRPVANQRGISVVPKDKDVTEIKITIPEKDSEISIIAENKYAASEPSTVRLKWKGKPTSEEFVIKPKLYVLAIGVSAYQNKNIALGFPAKDARDFAEAMQKQKGNLYSDVTAKVLTDEKATRDEIMDGLEWIQRETTSKDMAMIFLAGHGVNDASGIYYFLPVNADTEKLKRTGVVFSDIKNTINSIAGKVILFVDSCHSGNVMGTRRGVADVNAVVNELSSAENGAVVFAASTGKQYSLEAKEWNNGAFTKALVEGISGKADYTGKGKITINMLDLYLSERVKELTKGTQTPTTTKPQTISDFPVAVTR